MIPSVAHIEAAGDLAPSPLPALPAAYQAVDYERYLPEL